MINKVDTPQHFGLYRALVVAVDGTKLQVSVPELSGNAALGWALPCIMPLQVMPPGGSTVSVKIPMPGTAVWVLFEHGDAMHPVWVGVMSA